jgi:diguanylate cyclase (GGDEF)-like protein
MVIDSQLFQEGIVFAAGHIQAGARSFDDFSKAMVADVGDEIQPFLRCFYEAVRYYPGIDTNGMSPATEIEKALAAVIDTGAHSSAIMENDAMRKALRREVKPDRRSSYADMTPDELLKALEEKDRRMRNSHLTGLPNKLAYEEAEKLPVQVFADIDGLKQVNDNLGHDAGDSLIRAMADALANETCEVYHISGDEFYVQGASLQEIHQIMETARETLMENGFTYIDAENKQILKKGIGFSYGTANTIHEADAKLQFDKAVRKARGLRSGARDTDEHGNRKTENTSGGRNAFDEQRGAERISADRIDSVYCGRIVEVQDCFAIQKIGRRTDEIVRHELRNLSRIPAVNEIAEISYKNGRGTVTEQFKAASIEL